MFFGVRQHDEKDCGVAAFASICKYWGIRDRLSNFRKSFQVTTSGVSIYDICRVAKKYGFETEPLEGSFEELLEEEICGPFIAHGISENNFCHFIVVRKITRKKVFVFDPACGNEKWTIEKFLRFWTGYIITFEHSGKIKQTNKKALLFNEYLKIIFAHKKAIVISTVLAIIIMVLQYVVAFAYQDIMDSYIYDRKTDMFFITLIGLGIMYVIMSLCKMLRDSVSANMAKKIGVNLQNKFITKIMSAPIKMLDNYRTGEILSRFEEIESISNLIFYEIFNIIIEFVVMIISIFILYKISITLLCLILIQMLLFLIVSYFYIKKVKHIRYTVLDRYTNLFTDVKETLDSLITIKTLSYEKKNKLRLVKKVDEYQDNVIKGKAANIKYSFVVDILDNVIAIAMLAIGMNSIINGELTVGTLLLFISVEGYFVEPVISFVRIQLSLQDSVVSFARLDDILNIENEEEEWNHTKEIRFKDGDIEFKNLCFEYNNKIVFENKTFFIKQGITTAIVGKSGCGKTTLAKLLVGFYKCNQGDIKVCGTSIYEMNLREIRNHIYYISQNSRLLYGTIKDNITLENDIDKKIYNNVCSMCQIDEIVEFLDDGDNTMLGENGAQLSGGQRQKIILARGLLKNPDILIIDEGTSNIDEVSSKSIIKFIKEYRKNKTTIFILHNKELSNMCDSIIKLDGVRNEK